MRDMYTNQNISQLLITNYIICGMLIKIDLLRFKKVSWYKHPLLGLHPGLLLPAVLDRPAVGVPEKAGSGNAVRGVGVYQKHLGTGHVLRKREAVVLPRSYHQQRVHPRPPLGQHHQEYTVTSLAYNRTNINIVKPNLA